MFVHQTIQRERSRALDQHYQRQSDRQQMVFNSVSFLRSEPVQKKAEPKMNRGNRAHHREHDDECGNSAEQADDESDSTEEFSSDDKKGQNRRKAQMFCEGAHAAGKTGSAVPPQHFLSDVTEEYDSQYDAGDRHNPVSVRTNQVLDQASFSSTAKYFFGAGLSIVILYL